MPVPSNRHPIERRALLLLAATLTLLTLIYLPTLLTRPAGGETAYMDDVGEIQVALNTWGTIHHTGYPLFAILGNLTVGLLRLVGISPATAPALHSLLWGFVALAAFYLLIVRLTGRMQIAAALTLLLGLVRSVWIHNVIAEVYSLSFAFEVVLLAVALWTPVTSGNVRQRIWLLALIGGFGVAHHRMVAFIAPGLILAVWPGLRAEKAWRRTLVTLAAALPISLIGFLPYIYLPARALAGAPWVYGNPSTWDGFWHEFSGAEAAFLMRLPENGAALLQDIGATFRVIADEMTLPLALAGGIALLWAALARRSSFRREAWIALTGTVGYFFFLFFFHRAVMPEAVATPIIVMLILGLAAALDLMLSARPIRHFAPLLTPGAAILAAGLLVTAHYGFVHSLTYDSAGIEAIELAKYVPRDGGKAVLMLPWSSRFTAVAFSKYVTGENADLQMARHTADFGQLVAQGHTLYTFKDTFYRFPLAWWDGQIGHAYLTSPADQIVAIRTAPLTEAVSPQNMPIGHGVTRREIRLCQRDSNIQLIITWQAASAPDLDLSISVHLLGAESEVPLTQADSPAPVYGWYPTTRWTAGEIVQEQYSLPLLPGGTRIAVGMYAQPTPSQFVNFGRTIFPLGSLKKCSN